MTADILALFHPLIRKWFKEKVGSPTDIQKQAWPLIAEGEHVLITAPTGSGKTLTAFLWALQKLITNEWQSGQVRVLYISPLKALNNDVQRNLLKPLAELQSYFSAADEYFPAVQVLTRSGDTPQAERRKMLRRPPEILITTPESLNVMLSSKNSRKLFHGVETVILDEIHAVLDSKRGTHLMTAVERLVPLTGEFQRVALSATIRPLEPVADFIGGFTAKPAGEEYRYEKRPVRICKSTTKKEYSLTVDTIMQHMDDQEQEDALWQTLAVTFTKEIRQNKATLVFCNNRRAVEKMTRLINDYAGEALVYSHHGSLARELRLAVEEKLKGGELKGIIATNSLELGIDIGNLDAVLLVQTPPSLTSAIQRIGRAGHGVGQVSRGTLYPVYGRDFLEAAVTSLALPEADIEPVTPMEAPLDILAQILLSMTSVEIWDTDELYAFIKTSYPYRNLARKSYDLVLEMLAGRYADTRLRELRPRVVLDKLDRTVKARDGIALLLYQGGGTIPDRGYYDLRLADTKAKLGELDEEFVWERNIGESFLLGTQVWRILRITHNDVEVIPGDQTINIIPFWRSEEQNRDFFYAEKIACFLENAEQSLDNGELAGQLTSELQWSPEAAERLTRFLLQQRETTGTSLPHRHHLLIEHVEDLLNKSDNKQVVLHTLWGGKVNRPYAMALSAAWEKKYGYPLEIYANNDSIMLMLPHSFAPQELLTLVSPDNLESLLRQKLESSGFFGAKFRENAGRALLLPKAGFKNRMPLWLNRLRAKKMMAAVSNYSDFPMMLETWRSCLADEFDLNTVKQLLDEINSGQIQVSEAVTNRPSPFSADLIWRQTNKYMYEDDTPFSEKKSGLSEALLKELVYSPQLRPELPEELIRQLDEKLKRTAPGYAPADEEELLLWLKERLYIPAAEADALFSAIRRDHSVKSADLKWELAKKAAWIQLPQTEQPGLCALEVLPQLCSALELPLTALKIMPLHEKAESALTNGIRKLEAFGKADSDADTRMDTAVFIGQWLSFYGPVAENFICETFGLPVEALSSVLAALLEGEMIVTDVLTSGSEKTEVCDRENLERLFAMARRARAPRFNALPLSALPLFLAEHQGLVDKGTSPDDLQEHIEQLFGYPAPAQLWEEVILPARMEPYYSAWTDTMMQSSDLIWFGCGNKRIGFCFREDLELFQPREPDLNGLEEAKALFPDALGKYDLLTISRYTGVPSDELTKMLWQHAWRQNISNDNVAVLRAGILNKFTPAPLEEQRRGSGRRKGFNRWAATRPLQGNWFLLPQAEKPDPLEQEEQVKDKVRQLFQRYGVLFREVLQQEIPELQWRSIFRTLRLMEFSGEIYSGHFFEQLPGLQFASMEAYRFLQSGLNEHAIYWVNAADPASVCGLKLSGLHDELPSRLPSNYLVYRGPELKVVAQRNGKALIIMADVADPDLAEYFTFFKTLLTRDFRPLKSITVETINGESAVTSPYRKALEKIGFTGRYKCLELRRQY